MLPRLKIRINIPLVPLPIAYLIGKILLMTVVTDPTSAERMIVTGYTTLAGITKKVSPRVPLLKLVPLKDIISFPLASLAVPLIV